MKPLELEEDEYYDLREALAGYIDNLYESADDMDCGSLWDYIKRMEKIKEKLDRLEE